MAVGVGASWNDVPPKAANGCLLPHCSHELLREGLTMVQGIHENVLKKKKKNIYFFFYDVYFMDIWICHIFVFHGYFTVSVLMPGPAPLAFDATSIFGAAKPHQLHCSHQRQCSGAALEVCCALLWRDDEETNLPWQCLSKSPSWQCFHAKGSLCTSEVLKWLRASSSPSDCARRWSTWRYQFWSFKVWRFPFMATVMVWNIQVQTWLGKKLKHQLFQLVESFSRWQAKFRFFCSEPSSW